MKKQTIIAALLCLTLCACGGESQSAATPAPSAAPELSSTLPDAGLHQAEATETPEEPESPEESAEANQRRELALGFVDRPVAELYAAIGEPESADYAPSCLGKGEDGELYYEGFTVYTYREGGSETVTDVE